MTVDYRSPDTGRHRVQNVAIELTHDDATNWLVTFAKILIGIPLCFVGPILVALVMKGIEVRVRETWLADFWTLVLLVSLPLVPLLFWLERRSRGRFLEDALQSDAFEWATVGRFHYSLGLFSLWPLLTEFALYGPRLLLGVRDRFRHDVQSDAVLRAAAAAIVVRLLDADSALPIWGFVSAEWGASQVARAITYLQQRDWVSLSARKDRVWLHSSIRNRLNSL